MRLILCVLLAVLVAPACIDQNRAFVGLDSDETSDGTTLTDAVLAEVDGPDTEVVLGQDARDTTDPDETVGPVVVSDDKYRLTPEETEMTFFPGEGLRNDFIALVERKQGNENRYEPVEAGVSISFQLYNKDEGAWQPLRDALETDEDGVVFSNYWERIDSATPVQFRFVVNDPLQTTPSFVVFTARPTAVTRFATGAVHSCAATKDELFCWGYNGPSGSVEGPRPMTADVYVPEVGPGGYSRIDYPRLIPLPTQSDELVYTLPSGSEIKAVAAAGRVVEGVPYGPATCVSIDNPTDRNLDGIWCVGSNEDNRLGNNAAGGNAPRWTKVRFVNLSANTTPLPHAAALAAGGDHFCAIVIQLLTPHIYCWGSNSVRQLGAGNTTAHLTAVEVALPAEGPRAPLFIPLSIEAGDGNTCALTVAADPSIPVDKRETRLYCWGDNTHGQVAADLAPAVQGPRRFDTGALCEGDETTDLPSATQENLAVAVGQHHICAINQLRLVSGVAEQAAARACGVPTIAPRVACAGSNTLAQLGVALENTDNPTWASDAEPPARIPPEFFRTLVAGDAFTCGLTQSQNVYCWGAVENGQLGSYFPAAQPESQRLIEDGRLRFLGLWAGAKHACAWGAPLDGDDKERKLYCWGDNAFGQSGIYCDQTPKDDDCSGVTPREIKLF